MNIICIQVGYMAGAGISWLARINDYMEPTDVGGPATPRSPRLALYLLRPPTPFTLALSLNALLMATAYNLWRPLSHATLVPPLPALPSSHRYHCSSRFFSVGRKARYIPLHRWFSAFASFASTMSLSKCIFLCTMRISMYIQILIDRTGN